MATIIWSLTKCVCIPSLPRLATSGWDLTQYIHTYVSAHRLHLRCWRSTCLGGLLSTWNWPLTLNPSTLNPKTLNGNHLLGAGCPQHQLDGQQLVLFSGALGGTLTGHPCSFLGAKQGVYKDYMRALKEGNGVRVPPTRSWMSIANLTNNVRLTVQNSSPGVEAVTN